ncbi:Zinc finger BED domain containing protein 4 [Dissostichus eleginoides]|uniref:Zinc finger BED domain containing protein 4 n=1 Tax=Dissostichus eleginoides TaxID=100907 RepID=A0AAD9FK00_DISEL|nr:Zinc finger BED domain containing protein 4 [Dissostichus eleginoides]
MFNIERKVQATVTDNGSNFVKAFREFGQREEVEEGGQDGNEDAGFEDVGTILDGEGEDEGLQFCLPPHHCCASHTLNLIASKDLERAVPQGATRKLFYSAMAKCSAIWNKAHRSRLAAEAVEEIGKMKLIIPCVTWWNSEYNAVQKIVSLTDAQLAEVCERLAVPKLLANELAFLNEYAEVLNPLACALDLLQGETKCFLGLVIPTLQTLKKRLSDKKPHVRFFSEVIDTVIKAIDSRFQKWFSSREAKLATASSPQFRLWWLP